MDRIILDTNIICSDYRLSGIHASIFFKSLSRISSELTIPQVVLDEAINRYCEHMNACWKKILKDRREVERHLDKPLHLSFEAIDALEEESRYRQFLTKKIDSVGGSIVDYPDVPHQKIVKRALDRRKPFKRNGAGYRDTLIWETILSLLAEEGGPIAFVTNNKEDFGEGPEPHEDFIHDLNDIGIASSQVRIYSSLASCIDERIIPRLGALDSIARRLAKEQIPEFNVKEWIQKSLGSILADLALEVVCLGVEKGDCSAEFNAIDFIKEVKVDNVYELADGDYLVAISTKVSAYVTHSANFEQSQKSSILRDYFMLDPNDETPVYSVAKWDDFELDISVSLILQKDTYKILAVAIDEVGTTAGWIGSPARIHRHKK